MQLASQARGKWGAHAPRVPGWAPRRADATRPFRHHSLVSCRTPDVVGGAPTTTREARMLPFSNCIDAAERSAAWLRTALSRGVLNSARRSFFTGENVARFPFSLLRPEIVSNTRYTQNLWLEF